MKRISTVRILAAAFAVVLGAGLTACGSDDDNKGGSGDCSKCPDSAKSDCSKSYSDCTKSGEKAANCQQMIDAICALASGLGGDAGGSQDSGTD